jgi:hypothetical protein
MQSIFLLLQYPARLNYHKESLQPLGHPMTAVALRTVIKEMQSTTEKLLYYIVLLVLNAVYLSQQSVFVRHVAGCMW